METNSASYHGVSTRGTPVCQTLEITARFIVMLEYHFFLFGLYNVFHACTNAAMWCLL
jgi:hypothetical protein